MTDVGFRVSVCRVGAVSKVHAALGFGTFGFEAFGVVGTLGFQCACRVSKAPFSSSSQGTHCEITILRN